MTHHRAKTRGMWTGRVALEVRLTQPTLRIWSRTCSRVETRRRCAHSSLSKGSKSPTPALLLSPLDFQLAIP